ncbi:MAG: hypothetical protein [Caudoviricetes sp.]|nr:MAG: hypothetical protein [Caudoviricetes sp.]
MVINSLQKTGLSISLSGRKRTTDKLFVGCSQNGKFAPSPNTFFGPVPFAYAAFSSSCAVIAARIADRLSLLKFFNVILFYLSITIFYIIILYIVV